MAEPEIDAADAIEYVEQFMQAQGAYNPAAIAALAYARKALAENVSLRAALAGAEQATTDARQTIANLEHALNVVQLREIRQAQREERVRELCEAASRMTFEAFSGLLGVTHRDYWTLNPAAVLEALAADVPAAADHEHPGGYLSTACLHELHEPECGAAQRARNDDKPPHCKFCDSPCVCPCHTGGQVERAERVHADGCTLAADDPHHAGWCKLPLDPPADDPYWCDAKGHLTPLERISDGWARCSRCGERFLSGVPAAGEAEVDHA